jgi:hypothetical protein
MTRRPGSSRAALHHHSSSLFLSPIQDLFPFYDYQHVYMMYSEGIELRH